jgi:hypothetical protein
MKGGESHDWEQRATRVNPPWRNMATSQTPNPHRDAVGDRAPSAPPDGDPTTPPAETATPPRPPRRRRTAGDRRTTIDARTPPAADDSPTLTVIVQPRDFRLPNVLKHIEAGKIVLVIPHHDGPD